MGCGHTALVGTFLEPNTNVRRGCKSVECDILLGSCVRLMVGTAVWLVFLTVGKFDVEGWRNICGGRTVLAGTLRELIMPTGVIVVSGTIVISLFRTFGCFGKKLFMVGDAGSDGERNKRRVLLYHQSNFNYP
jgi:hypothetical protein